MYEDSYHDLAHDDLDRRLLRHPLGRPVIGTTDAVNAMNPESVREYHANRYVGSNIVIRGRRQPRARAAGARDRAALRPLRQVPDPAPACGRCGSASRIRRSGSRPRQRAVRRLLAGSAARSDRRRFAASLLDSILGGSASSRLFQEIARSAAWPTRSTRSHRSTRNRMVGVYVGTREDTGECMRITRAANHDGRGAT